MMRLSNTVSGTVDAKWLKIYRGIQIKAKQRQEELWPSEGRRLVSKMKLYALMIKLPIRRAKCLSGRVTMERYYSTSPAFPFLLESESLWERPCWHICKMRPDTCIIKQEACRFTDTNISRIRVNEKPKSLSREDKYIHSLRSFTRTPLCLVIKRSAYVSVRFVLFTLSVFTSTAQQTGLNVIPVWFSSGSQLYLMERQTADRAHHHIYFQRVAWQTDPNSQQGHKSSLIQTSPSKSNKTHSLVSSSLHS